MMIDVAREAKMTTKELAVMLVETQNQELDVHHRLYMMSVALATAIQRLAADD